MIYYLSDPNDAHQTSLPEDDPFWVQEKLPLEPHLLDFVYLRLAQIYHSADRIDSYSATLKTQGEPEERIKNLRSWRLASLYDGKERAVLALTEAMASDKPAQVSRQVIKNLRRYFNEAEIIKLVLAITMVRESFV